MFQIDQEGVLKTTEPAHLETYLKNNRLESDNVIFAKKEVTAS